MEKGWRRQNGTVGHPYSALNLRLVLATFGFVTMAALTGVLWWLDIHGLAIVTAVIAVIAAINVTVVIRRRRERKRLEQERGQSTKHTLFE